MEVIILLLIILFIIIYSRDAKLHKEAQQRLERKIDALTKESVQLKTVAQNWADKNFTAPSSTPKEEEASKPVAEVRPVKPAAPVDKPLFTDSIIVPQPPTSKTETSKRYTGPPPSSKESWTAAWFRNNPDLEKFIGENLINKIGIAILVLGIAFFVKYAIDKNWINEVGRVCIGLFCGTLLVGLAHCLRNSYRSFSSVLAGGGIAVFYFTIAFAFHQYSLLSQTTAFLLMVVITGFAIALSLLYNKLELAVIAVVGGFVTPFLVSTGQGNYIVLFTYLIILNAGLLLLSFFKRWTLINTLAFLFTVVIFGGWLFNLSADGLPVVSYPLALLFATVLYLLFLGMNMAYQLRYKQDFRAFDYSLLLSLNASYFAAGLVLVDKIDSGTYRGLFTLGIGVINLALAFLFFKQKKGNAHLLYLLIGLTLTFLTLTVPIQLHRHAITLFWTVEGVLLFWLYQRSRIAVFYYSSLVVAFAALVSLGMDWVQAAFNESMTVTLIYTNLQGFVTNIVAVLSFALFGQLVRREVEPLPALFTKKALCIIMLLVAGIITYLTAIYGVNLFFSNALNYEVPNVYHRLITELVVLLILVWLRRKFSDGLAGLGIGAIGVYLVYHLLSMPLITGLRNGVLAHTYSYTHLLFHWLSVLSALALVYYAVQELRRTKVTFFSVSGLCFIMSLLLIIFFSQEAEHLFVSLIYKTDVLYGEKQYEKAGLTIVWALCSFGLMWFGMKYKVKALRIISLSVFSLALVKLFFFDLSGISEGGKITAFILLGVLLLTISFMYQKLKKIIIDEKG